MPEVKTPTWEEYKAYLPEHGNPQWSRIRDDWQCRGCGRTKFELLRWTQRRKRVRTCKPYMGWNAAVYFHHDHMEGFGLKRFRRTLVCDHCNAVDNKVRQNILSWFPDADGHRSRIHPNFSFSPHEIRQIITPRPHAPHDYNFTAAWEIYRAIVNTSAFGYILTVPFTRAPPFGICQSVGDRWSDNLYWTTERYEEAYRFLRIGWRKDHRGLRIHGVNRSVSRRPIST